MGRVLGLDYGTKRLGFALSDPTGMLATPHSVETLADLNQTLNVVERKCRETGATKLVIGLPKNMNGTLGPAAEGVLKLKEQLEKRLTIPVETWDERLSTVSAHNAMLEADLSRAKRKQVVDKLAAQIFLQNYLDAHTAPPGNEEEL
ncbi:MAG: Holliday junction resolvase RuvX [Verrucomicrobia bacterium]|nr:MAG: Holliday junction resolvase RuvX [Verrucomicrobiota bacterium]